VRAGADALGFLFGVPRSVRSHIDPSDARGIIRNLPPYISSVLVTTLTEPLAIQELIEQTPVSGIQLHGPLQPDDVRTLRNRNRHMKLIKTVQVVDENALQEARRWEPLVDAVLLDSKGEGGLGGTGRAHDWDLSARVVAELRVPVILAGGLSPGNVAHAIRTVRPFGVDVNSGVTSRPPGKDPQKVEEFVRQVRQAT
jgi:phosphoribosylanthranilate isomerase